MAADHPRYHRRADLQWRMLKHLLEETNSLISRVPAVYLTWANPVFLAFFAFNRINNLRIFNAAFSSIPTAPTIDLPDGGTLSKVTRGQKGADKANHPVLVRWFSAAWVTTGFVSASSSTQNHHWAISQTEWRETLAMLGMRDLLLRR